MAEAAVKADAACTNSFQVQHAGSSTGGKVITCKAAVAWSLGEPLKLEVVEVDPPQAMEVRIRVLFTSICYSDIGAWKNEAHRHLFPRIFGHEASGVVESVGAGVTDLSPGDHVLPLFHGECGSCAHCDPKRRSNMCAKFRVNSLRSTMYADGKTRFFVSVPGQPRVPVHHYLGTSTFSEYTVVDAACVVRLPAGAPLDRMCLLSCGVTTGVGAAWYAADVKEGSTVAVFGLGTIGLEVVQGARVRGASKIIGIDVNLDKCMKGREMGVTDFVNPNECGEQSVHEVIQAMTGGGVDYCFECVGKVDVLQEAYLSTHDGWGLTVVLGVYRNPQMLLQLHPMQLLYGRRIAGSVFGDVKGRSQLPYLIDKCLDGTLNLDGFVTHELPFDEINQAFTLLQEGKSLRCVLRMPTN